MSGRGKGAPIAEMRKAKKKKAPPKNPYEGYAEAAGAAMRNRKGPPTKNPYEGYAEAAGAAMRNRKGPPTKRKEAPAREEDGGGKRRKNPKRAGRFTRLLAESRLPDGRTTLRKAKLMGEG